MGNAISAMCDKGPRTYCTCTPVVTGLVARTLTLTLESVFGRAAVHCVTTVMTYAAKVVGRTCAGARRQREPFSRSSAARCNPARSGHLFKGYPVPIDALLRQQEYGASDVAMPSNPRDVQWLRYLYVGVRFGVGSCKSSLHR